MTKEIVKTKNAVRGTLVLQHGLFADSRPHQSVLHDHGSKVAGHTVW